MGLPSNSLCRLRALDICPGWGLMACSSSRKTRSVPKRASTAIAAVTSAVFSNNSKSSSARTSIPSIPSVPLIRARPSLVRSRMGSRRAVASARRAGTISSPSSTHPSPMRQSPTWARGARSPLAPSEPCSGTAGTRPSFSRAINASTSSTLTPENPMARVFARIAIIARTTSGSTNGPAPAEWLRKRERWSSRRSGVGMCVVASAPKPVVTP